MNILVLNAGSSSLKYQVIEMPSENVKCMGLVERIGELDAIFTHKIGEKTHSEVLSISNHKEGLNKITSTLLNAKIGVIDNVDEIKAVGHRVVHGGNKFSKTTIINTEVKEIIRELSHLAPLHNPVNLVGIEIAETIFTNAKQIAVFDSTLR